MHYLCLIWYLQRFSWLSDHSSIDYVWQQFIACWSVSSVKHCKCYLFLKGSPSCSCPLQLHKHAHAKFPLTHLQRPLHTILHPQWMTSSHVSFTSWGVVQWGTQLSCPWEGHGNTGSFRTGFWHDKFTLKHYPLGMINKCHFGWRNAGEDSCFFLAQLLPSAGTCEAACSAVKMIHKLRKAWMCSSLIPSGDAPSASALRLTTLTRYCILLWHGTCIDNPEDLSWPSDVEPVRTWRSCRSFPVPQANLPFIC